MRVVTESLSMLLQRHPHAWKLGLQVLAFVGVGAAYFTHTYGDTISLEGTALALCAAGVPLVLVTSALIWLDRFEAEPFRYVLFSFAWGAVVAAALAPTLVQGSLVLVDEEWSRERIRDLVVLPALVEEPLKISALLIIMLVRRHQCDGVIDCVVYGAMCAAGFAFAENVIDMAQAWDQGTSETLFQVFIVRCVMGAFAHPLFTFCAAWGIGTAIHQQGRWMAALTVVAGFAGAAALHMGWNYSIKLGTEGFVTLYLTLQLPVFVAAVAFAIFARVREGKVLAAALRPWAAAGVLRGDEVTMMSDLRVRAVAVQGAHRAGGPAGRAAMKALQRGIVELVYCELRHHRRASLSSDEPDLEAAVAHIAECRRRLVALCVRYPNAAEDPVSRAACP